MRIRTLAVSLALSAGLLFAQGDSKKDDVVYDQVRLKLAGDRDVGGGAIDVEVHDGVVTLKGKVSTSKQKSRAEKLAKKVKGVKSVVNDLTVSP
jgi:osmotically-inducible protein OsmY